MTRILTEAGWKELQEYNPAKQGREAAKAEDDALEAASTNIDDAIKNAEKAGNKKLAKQLKDIRRSL